MDGWRCICGHVRMEHSPDPHSDDQDTLECDVCGCDEFEWDGEED